MIISVIVIYALGMVITLSMKYYMDPKQRRKAKRSGRNRKYFFICC